MNNVAILGFGTIGRNVDQIITSLNKDIKVIKVLDLPSRKDELKERWVGDYLDIVNDDSISVVFEALGGDGLSYQAITASLKKGKSVITSNKETVSKHLDEYLSLAKHNNAQFLFEASVGGGIPLLHTIIDICKYDEIKSFKGIVNGTTNYILTKLGDRIPYASALKEAQDKGFAERDPSADLKGIDVLRKGCILASLIYNTKVDYQKVPYFGVENINDEIYSIFEKENKQLKLIVEGKLINGALSLLICPTVLDNSSLLSTIKYENNCCILDCKFNDTLTFIGKGAGGLPTASAMVKDLFDVLNNNGSIERNNVKELDIVFDKSQQFYVFDDNNKFEIISVNSAEELKKYKFVAKVGK